MSNNNPPVDDGQMSGDWVRELNGRLGDQPQAEEDVDELSQAATNNSPLNRAKSRISQFKLPNVVRIPGVRDIEINLTSLWETLTAPAEWLKDAFFPGGSGVGRKGRGKSRLVGEPKQLKKLKLMRTLSLFGAGAVAFGIVFFFALFIFYSRQLPKPGEVVRRSGFSTRIMDRNGEVLHDLYDETLRTPVKIEEMPDYLKYATVAIEDKDFYQHQGFDAMTILRIPYNAILRRRIVGGSTLTQQLVKNALLSNERTVTRKFKELVLSLQIERTFTKDQILEMYLNEAPYGGATVGVGAAAEFYFNKSVKDLSLEEAVILAGLPQRPSAYSPFAGRTDDDGTLLWLLRARGVLRRMQEDGYLTDLAYEDAMAKLESVEFNKGETGIKAPHFVFYVQDQLEKIYGPEMLERGGLQVTTTLDYELQRQAQEIVAEEIDKVEQLNITNGAAMVVNPQTGEIIAMIGSRDFNHEEIDGQFNVAVNGLRQPGSSIKPVVYLGMLQRGYTPATMLLDVATTFQRNAAEKPYEPKNYDGKFRGPVSLRNSLGSSLNIPAVKSLAMVGIEEFLATAYDMGFVTLEPTQENLRNFGLSVALGGGEVHLIDSVTAFSAFANGGYRVEPISILEVKDADGKVLFNHQPEAGRQVMLPQEAYLINNILSDNNARAIAFGTNSLLNVSPNVAVKTGTTNDQRDNWAIGWSQDVMVGAWVGNNDNSAMKTVASGVSGATPIWRRIMLLMLDNGFTAPTWEKPEGIDSVSVDLVSGYQAHDDFPSREEIAIAGSVPSGNDPIHVKLKLCKGEDKLANDARVAAGDYDEKEYFILQEDDPFSEDGENRWQLGINAWLEGNGDSRYHPPTEYCGEQSEVFVRVEKPKNEQEFENEDIDVRVKAGSGDGIDKIEIYVDGSKRETINSYQYEGKINMGSGQHEIWAKAYTRGGEEKESDHIKIGTGGQPWKQPDPTATPVPTSTPIPTITKTPTSAPTSSLTPTTAEISPTSTPTLSP